MIPGSWVAMLEGLELLKWMIEETETLNRPVSSNLG